MSNVKRKGMREVENVSSMILMTLIVNKGTSSFKRSILTTQGSFLI